MAHNGETFTFTVSSELHVTTAEQVLIETYIEDCTEICAYSPVLVKMEEQ
jgi:hypothetical protein